MDTIIDDILIACYGTLRLGHGNYKNYLTNSDHVGTGKTIEKYTMTGNTIPYVSKKPLHNVIVDVFKINKSTLERLDNLEGHPDWYKREQIEVEVKDEVVKAWLYFNEGYHNSPIIKDGDYNNR